MKRSVCKLAVVTLAAAALVLSALPADAGASRTRPRGSSANPPGGRSVAVSGHATRGTAPTRVSGRATYGYYGSGSYYPSYWYPYYGYPGSYWWYWGWPYYGYWAYWGWPYHYGPYSSPGPARNAPAVVETDIRPKKAEVLLDDDPVGQARDYNGSWDSLAVKPGSHVLEFRHPGYMSLRVHLDARPGARYTISEQLARGEGIDPRSIEVPSAAPAGLPAEPPAARPPTEAAGVASAERPPQPGSLARGLLRIQASPPDAAVYLDGEFLASADELGRMHGALPVAAGLHVIEVVRPGYEAQRVEVEVIEEEPARVSIDLVPRP